MLQLQSQSAFTALSVSDLQLQLNLLNDTTTELLLSSYLKAAVAYCEKRLELDLRTTTWNLVLEQFPIWNTWSWMGRYGDYIYGFPWVAEFAVGRVTQKWQAIFLRGPLQTVNSIQYYDSALNTLQTLDPTTYRYTTPSYFYGILEPTVFFPVAYPRPDSVTINFTSGMTTVPDSILQAIRLLVASWFMQREDISYGPNSVGHATGEAIECLLDQYMVPTAN